MCGICGCGGTASVTVLDGEGGESAARFSHHHGQVHAHDGGYHHHGDDGHHHDGHHHHDHQQAHGHAPPATLVEVETRVLARNDALAARNRAWFAGRQILCVNLVSSPGAGKTALLERTIGASAGNCRFNLWM